MQDWKQAFWLAKFELKVSLKSCILYFTGFILLSLFFLSSLGSYLDNSFVGVDIAFLLFFSIAPALFKPKAFQYQKISGDLSAAPSFIMYTQLPISKDILIKSRFIIYFLNSFPLQLLLLILLYVFSPDLQIVLSPFSYIAFAIIWLSFGVYAGYVMPASDVGDVISTGALIVLSIVLYGGFIAVFTAIHLTFQYGIVYWTIIFAQERPLLSIALSILLAIIGMIYWKSYMVKKIGKLDYL